MVLIVNMVEDAISEDASLSRHEAWDPRTALIVYPDQNLVENTLRKAEYKQEIWDPRKALILYPNPNLVKNTLRIAEALDQQEILYSRKVTNQGSKSLAPRLGRNRGG
jgi:hypothetical protein